MPSNFSVLNLNLFSLATNLGISYNTLIKYRHDDLVKFEQYVGYVNDITTPGADNLAGSVFGLPLLQRYATITAEEPRDPADPNSATSYYKSIFLETLVINVTNAKEISMQKVLGLPGTVKEFISSGDLSIELTGSLVSPNAYSYPDDLIMDFLNICAVNKTVQIDNQFLGTYFKVKDIVILESNLMESSEFANTVFYSIKAVSDNSGLSMITQTKPNSTKIISK